MSSSRPRCIRRRDGPQPIRRPPNGNHHNSQPAANAAQASPIPVHAPTASLLTSPPQPHFRIVQASGNGWEYPISMISKPMPPVKILLIRGVRLFSLRYEFNRVHSYVPFTKYAMVLYNPSIAHGNLSQHFNRYKNFKWVDGFLRASDGEFLPRSRWDHTNLQMKMS